MINWKIVLIIAIVIITVSIPTRYRMMEYGESFITWDSESIAKNPVNYLEWASDECNHHIEKLEAKTLQLRAVFRMAEYKAVNSEEERFEKYANVAAMSSEKLKEIEANLNKARSLRIDIQRVLELAKLYEAVDPNSIENIRDDMIKIRGYTYAINDRM